MAGHSTLAAFTAHQQTGDCLAHKTLQMLPEPTGDVMVTDTNWCAMGAEPLTTDRPPAAGALVRPRVGLAGNTCCAAKYAHPRSLFQSADVLQLNMT